MNTKSKILLIAICAAVTLSFTFSTSKVDRKAEGKVKVNTLNSEPAGGFLSEDKF